MVANIGFTALLMALLFCFSQPILSLIFRESENKNSFLPLKIMPLANFIFSLIALISLIYCYVISDFSVSNVYQNSHSLKPLLYKISGTWGNHEGSMLLLLCILNGYNIAFAIFGKIDHKKKTYHLSFTINHKFWNYRFYCFHF